MKRQYFILILFSLFLFACSTLSNATKENQELSAPQYDAELASKLGADSYGMRSFVLGLLKTGPNDANITNEEKRRELFSAHSKNIRRLAAEEKLLLAGPLDGKMQRRGIFIFNVTTLEEAAELIKSDPAITAGIFDVDLHKFYGSAALLNVNEVHQKIRKPQPNN